MLDILLIDDEPSIRLPVGQALRAEGHQVSIASDGAEAMAQLDDKRFELVVSDVRLPKIDGFTILRRLRRESPGTDVLLMTAYGSVADAVAAMKERAVDYVQKPFEVETLLEIVERIDARRRVQQEFASARSQDAASRSSIALVGRSGPICRLRDEIETIAASEASVLLTGESGTGKELVARMIHEGSPRHSKPFVAVNCAALPGALIEAELFGHERGAFTGAVRRREGRLLRAHGGTLFLDEIGEMSPEAQVKLLRALQEGTFEPLGTNDTVRVDVRVISATNRELKARTEEGRFREDLYYRIRVIELRLPPLRERMGDLPLLVEHFLAELSTDGTLPTVSPEVWAALAQYPFPGNVRELRHAIQHATILARGEEIDLGHLPRELRGDSTPRAQAAQRTLPYLVAQFEREHIERTLRMTGGERMRAAKMLGISRKTLWKKMRRYGMVGRDEAPPGAEPPPRGARRVAKG